MSDEIKKSLEALSDAMKNDPEYAWTWHCALAMMAVDAGAGYKEANERAASFMWGLFGVNTAENPCYKVTESLLEILVGENDKDAIMMILSNNITHFLNDKDGTCISINQFDKVADDIIYWLNKKNEDK